MSFVEDVREQRCRGCQRLGKDHIAIREVLQCPTLSGATFHPVAVSDEGPKEAT